MIKNKHVIVLLILALFGLSFVGSSFAARPVMDSGDKKEAKEFIIELKEEGLDEVMKADIDKKEKIEKFKDMVMSEVDFEFVSRFVMGAKWRDMNHDQQGEFIENFKKMNIYSWAKKFDLYQGEEIEVTGTTDASQSDQVFVDLKMIPNEKGKEPSYAKFRVRKTDGGELVIVDIVVEGISMALNYRDEFKSIMDTAGSEGKNGIQELLSKLKSKAESLKKEAYEE